MKPILTKMQRDFCNEYLKNGGNGTQAALKAGYSPATATRQASQVLKKPVVQEYLQRAQKRLEKADIAKVEDILYKLTKMMDDPNVTDQNKLKAMDMLLKVQGAYLERVEVTKNNIKIVIDEGEADA